MVAYEDDRPRTRSLDQFAGRRFIIGENRRGVLHPKDLLRFKGPPILTQSAGRFPGRLPVRVEPRTALVMTAVVLSLSTACYFRQAIASSLIDQIETN